MRNKLKNIKEQIHALIDVILFLEIETKLAELVAKHIALQNRIISSQLNNEELEEYFLDEQVKCYVKKYQDYCLDLEIHLENLITKALLSSGPVSDIALFLRHYYSSIYESMTKNEIALSRINKKSKVCMVGIGSMPLSMLFMHRFTGADIVGIDKSSEVISSTQECVEFVSQYAPDRYNHDAFSVIAADGEVFDYEDFDVVILSIHIANKDAVIRRILNTSNNRNLILLDRGVVGLCQYFYKSNPIDKHNVSLSFVDNVNSGVITTKALFCKTEKA